MTDTDGSAASEVTDLLSEKELQLVRSRASICRTCYLLNTFAGNFCGHGNSKSDAFFVAGPARRSQPLGEYCVRRAMHRDHDSGDQGWLAFLYCLRIDRNRADCTYRLVRMDLAEAS
jgi:hypothetical protein